MSGSTTKMLKAATKSVIINPKASTKIPPSTPLKSPWGRACSGRFFSSLMGWPFSSKISASTTCGRVGKLLFSILILWHNRRGLPSPKTGWARHFSSCSAKTAPRRGFCSIRVRSELVKYR